MWLPLRSATSFWLLRFVRSRARKCFFYRGEFPLVASDRRGFKNTLMYLQTPEPTKQDTPYADAE